MPPVVVRGSIGAAHIAASHPDVDRLLIVAFNFESDAFQSEIQRGKAGKYTVFVQNRDLMIERVWNYRLPTKHS